MIKFNGKDIIPRFNGKDVSRVMYNGKQIYPSNKGIDPATAPNGVYIYSNDGLLYNLDDWDAANNDSAVGVAVITDNTRMCIGKSGRNSGVTWSNDLYGTDILEITNAGTSGTDDYGGQYNTNIIRQRTSDENSNNNAAHWCYAQTITVNGSIVHGYLPAIGELHDAYQNKSAVDNAMNQIGGANILSNYNWSSSESSYYPTSYARGLRWTDGNINFSYKNRSYYCTVPVFPLT